MWWTVFSYAVLWSDWSLVNVWWVDPLYWKIRFNLGLDKPKLKWEKLKLMRKTQCCKLRASKTNDTIENNQSYKTNKPRDLPATQSPALKLVSPPSIYTVGTKYQHTHRYLYYPSSIIRNRLLFDRATWTSVKLEPIPRFGVYFSVLFSDRCCPLLPAASEGWIIQNLHAAAEVYKNTFIWLLLCIEIRDRSPRRVSRLNWFLFFFLVFIILFFCHCRPRWKKFSSRRRYCSSNEHTLC